jgi:hypothetical protein
MKRGINKIIYEINTDRLVIEILILSLIAVSIYFIIYSISKQENLNG